MKKPHNYPIIRTAMRCFTYSLLIGTLFFLTFIVTKNETISVYGFFYLCAAIIINLIMLLTLLVTLLTISENRIGILKAMGLLVINIPIAYFYFWIITEIHLL